MIFVAAGTQDGRELVAALLAEGYAVTASVVSEYGQQLLEKYPGLVINNKPLDEEALAAYITAHKIDLFVDASHPYAANVSQNAMNACHSNNIPYVRYERQSVDSNYEKIFYVVDYDEAAKKASQLGRNIFLTTGSRNIAAFVKSPYLQGYNLTARILPTADVIAMCTELGLTPKNLIAIQGPFSKELNKELYRKYEADVVITKNSGQIGGTDTKLEAAAELGLPVIMIGRPQVAYDNLRTTFAEVVAFVKTHLKM